MKAVRHFFAGILFAFYTLLPCRAQELALRHFTPDNGLPSSEVHYIHQDRRGYIWFATDKGLCRYDGYRFEIFTTQNGLGDNVVFNIVEDGEGTLWFATFSRGLYCYSYNRGFFEAGFNAELLKIIKGRNMWVNKLLFDDEGRPWFNMISEYERHTFYYSPDGKTLKKYMADWAGKGEQPIISLGKNTVLYEGINYENSIMPDTQAFRAHQYPNGNTALYSPYHGLRGCLRKDDSTLICATTKNLIQICRNRIVSNCILPVRCISLTKNSDGLWVATIDGAYLFKWGNMQTPQGYYIPKAQVTCVLRDNEGNYWFSTLDQGVYMAPSLNLNFFSPVKEKVVSLSRQKNELYGVTFSKKIFRINQGAIGQCTFLYKENKKLQPAMLSEIPYHFINADFLINEKGQIFENTVASRAKCMLELEDKFFFGCTDGFIEMKFNGNATGSDKLNFTQRTNAVYRDTRGKIWMGTLSGLYSYIPGSGRVDREEKISMRVNVITGNSNTLIVGTNGGGIFFLSPQGVHTITKTEGLAGNNISTFLLQDTVLWVGTNQGFSRVLLRYAVGKLEVADIQSFTRSDGLESNEINAFEWFDNRLWIATNKGLMHVQPQLLVHKKKKEMPAYILGVEVNDSAYNWKPDGISLAYDQRNLNINYSNIAFADPAATCYFYKLEGLHNQWLKTAEKNVKFVNLPPGDYTFYVSAANSFTGIVPQKPSKLFIHIDRHFTETWWFAALGFSVLFGALLLGVRAYIKDHQKKLQVQKKLILSEQQALRAQMNPHFIFNALNSVQYYITENDKRSAGIFLAKFSSLVRTILDNSGHSTITLENELASLKKYLELEQVRFGNKFSFAISVNENIPLSDIKIPTMLVQPFLENAIWHGLMPKNTQGTLALTISQNTEGILFTITDDGIGRQQAAQIKRNKPGHHSSAIENIEKRIHLVEQLLGLRIHLAIIDLYKENGESNGTRVDLLFQVKK